MAVVIIHPNPATFASARRQHFSLPFDVMKYVTANPRSPGSLVKLQKTCKHFFSQNKVVVVKQEMSYLDADLTVIHTLNHIRFRQKYNFGQCKFWLLGVFGAGTGSRLMEDIYRCNLKHLFLNDKNLSKKEFDFLVEGSHLEGFRFNYVTVYEENGSLVTCDRILAQLPNIRLFQYESADEVFTTQTFQRMNALQFKFKLYRFDLAIYGLPRDAKYLLLCDFIKSNLEISALSQIWFRLAIENAETIKSTLESAIHEMYQSEIPKIRFGDTWYGLL